MRSEQFKPVWVDEILTNDNYSDIKLYIIFHIEYMVIEFITSKKEPTITFPIRQYWNDNEATPAANGGLVNKRRIRPYVTNASILIRTGQLGRYP